METISPERNDGALTIRTAQEGESLRVCLCGELDLANVRTAWGQLEAALATTGPVIVDMQELEFIDSSGIAMLVRVLQTAGDDRRLRFVPSSASAVTRVLEITGIEERLPKLESAADGSGSV